MHTLHRLRGILAASANGNPAAVLGELHNAFAAFRERNEDKMSNLERGLDDVNASIAAMKIGGAGGDPLDATEGRQARAAVTEFMRTGRPDAMTAMVPRAEMSTDSDPNGGYTVPREIDRTIQNQMVPLSPMRRLASVVPVSTSDYHKLINKRGATTGWAGERDARTETETPLLADIVPPMGELWAYPSVTQWSLDDSQFNLQNFVQENISDEMALQEGAAFIGGDGMKKPMGLLSAPTADTPDETRPFGTLQFVTSGAADGFASTAPADSLISLVYSVKAVYRAGDGVAWQMNSKTAGAIRKMKDGEGNYLWQEALTQGQPPLLCGYPVWENEDMPDIGANAFPVAFGNFKKGYMIVDRIGTRIIRDPFTKPGWVRFYVSKRVGGAPTDTRAIKLLKIAV